MLRVLGHSRDFARLWAAQAVSLVGDWFTLIALAVLISGKTGGSGLAVSGLLLTQLIPSVAMGPLAGVFADRFDRRRLLIATDLARALIVLLFIPAAAGQGVVWLYALACLHFGVSTAFEPTRSALLPSLVEPRELVAAATLSSVTWSVMTALGGLLGGAVLSAIGVRAAFLVDALTFVASAALIRAIGTARPAALPAEGPSTRPRFRDGLRYAAAHPATGACLFVKSINGLALVDTFMVIYATRLFVLGPSGAGSLGVFWACFGLGAVLGPLALNLVNDGTVRRMRRLIVAGAALMSAALFTLGAAPSLSVAALAILLRGMGGSITWTYSTVILQKTVPDHLRGRLFAMDQLNTQVTAALAAVVGGFGIDRLDVRTTALLAAGVSLGPLSLWTASLPWMERREPGDDAAVSSPPSGGSSPQA